MIHDLQDFDINIKVAEPSMTIFKDILLKYLKLRKNMIWLTPLTIGKAKDPDWKVKNLSNAGGISHDYLIV